MKDNSKEYVTNLNLFIIVLLVLAVMLFVFSLFAPLIFTNPSSTKNLDFTQTGPIGDTIGGLMSPFINLSGVIVTGLAFYMQYRANRIQVNIFQDQLSATEKQFTKEQKSQEDQLKLQQFESQFYEMLRLHKENVNEIEISSYKTGKSAKGRQAFVVMAQDYRELLLLADLFDGALTPEEFEAAYSVFFWGFSEDELKKLSSASEAFISGNGVIGGEVPLPYIKDHQGYGSALGHYFRHLFMMVKFVVKSSVVNEYKEKMKYLKILRAQLSNHEQIMLFYNWLSTYGGPWENDENQFFTEYVMIHNLWKEELLQNEFILKKIQDLENKPAKLRKKELFEYQEKKD